MRRSGWLELVIRMDETMVAKKIFRCKPEDGRKVGRSRLRWLEDAENDLQK
jgi:hypothetical protein